MFIHTPVTSDNLPAYAGTRRVKGLDVFDTETSTLYRLLIHLDRPFPESETLSPVELTILCNQAGREKTAYVGQSAIDFWIGLIPAVQEVNEDAARAMGRWAEDAARKHRKFKQGPFDIATFSDGQPGAII